MGDCNLTLALNDFQGRRRLAGWFAVNQNLGAGGQRRNSDVRPGWLKRDRCVLFNAPPLDFDAELHRQVARVADVELTAATLNCIDGQRCFACDCLINEDFGATDFCLTLEGLHGQNAGQRRQCQGEVLLCRVTNGQNRIQCPVACFLCGHLIVAGQHQVAPAKLPGWESAIDLQRIRFRLHVEFDGSRVEHEQRYQGEQQEDNADGRDDGVESRTALFPAGICPTESCGFNDLVFGWRVAHQRTLSVDAMVSAGTGRPAISTNSSLTSR